MTDEEITPRCELTPERSPARTALAVAGGAVVLGVLWAVLQLWGLGKMPLHTHGEAREGLVVWQITHHGGWILPLRDGPTGAEVPSKPPLFHWLGALVAIAHGRTDEWSIRLPSALLSLGGILTTYAAGVALWGPASGLMGATVVMTSFEWQRAATGARVDMALSFGLLVAFFSYLFVARSGGRSRWLVPFYGGMAFAVLAKGPVGVVLPGLLIAALCALQRDVSPLRRLRLVRGLIAVALIAGFWYVLALIEGGFVFFGKQVLNENVYRMFSSSEYEGGHRHGVVYLFLTLLAGFLPWTLFVPGPAIALWRARRRLSASDPRVYLLLWIAVVFGLYALAVSKRSVYLLALYPALGLLVGWWWAAKSTDPTVEESDQPRWWRLALRVAALAAAGIVALVLAATVVEWLGLPLIEWIAGLFSPEARLYADWVAQALGGHALASSALLAGAGAALWWLARALREQAPGIDRRRRWRAVFVALVATLAASDLLAQQILLPEIAVHRTYRQLMPAVRRIVGPENDRLSFYRTFDYVAAFYWGGRINNYQGELTADAPPYLLMSRQQWQKLPADDRARLELVPLPAGDETEGDDRLVLVHKRVA